jgi:hypothetical protein
MKTSDLMILVDNKNKIKVKKTEKEKQTLGNTT